MGEIIRMKGSYKNYDAVENVIHYITRTRTDEKKGDDLISVGGAGVAFFMGAEEIINQMKSIQDVFSIKQRSGRRMYHEIFQIYPHELEALGNNYQVIHELAFTMTQYYFQRGHQVAFAVQSGNTGLHIHLAVNTINFCTGLKWHDSMTELKERETCFNQIMCNYIGMVAARSNSMMING